MLKLFKKMGLASCKDEKDEEGSPYLSEEATHSFKESLPLEHSIGQSPFKHFERIGELGLGSMGAVMRVEKKSAYLKPKEARRSRRPSLSGSPASNRRSPLSLSPGGPMGRRPSLPEASTAITALFRGGNKTIDIDVQGKVQSRFAMKRIILSKLSDEYREELRNEISILRDLDHPNIVRLYEIYDVKSQIYVVMELCDGGDLWERKPYSERDAATLTKKIVSAVTHMHEMGVCHRDLKMENVLFENESPNAEIKIIDFGLSKKFTPGEKMKSRVGSYYT